LRKKEEICPAARLNWLPGIRAPELRSAETAGNRVLPKGAAEITPSRSTR
jgi:hypothetical protein